MDEGLTEENGGSLTCREAQTSTSTLPFCPGETNKKKGTTEIGKAKLTQPSRQGLENSCGQVKGGTPTAKGQQGTSGRREQRQYIRTYETLC